MRNALKITTMVATMMLAACSSDDKSAADASSGSATGAADTGCATVGGDAGAATGDATTGDAGDATTGDAGDSTTGDSTTGGDAGDATTGGADHDGGTTCDEGTGTTGGGTTGGMPEPQGNARSAAFLQGSPWDKIVIELDVEPGKAPRQAAMDAVVAELEAVVDKPGGIEVVVSENLEFHDEDFTWSKETMFAYGDETYDLEVGPTSIKMHIMWVGGKFAESLSDSGGTVGGWAWSNKHTMLFADTIEDLCSSNSIIGVGKEQMCTAFERALLLHELGHVLGLVNAGVPMQEDHQDEEHGAHDDSKQCIMYWSYEGSGLADALTAALTGGEEPSFGPKCKADMEALKNAAQ